MFVTLPRMSTRLRRDTARRRAPLVAVRRLAGLAVVAAVLLVTLGLTAFGSGSAAPAVTASAGPAVRAAAGPPRPEIVAVRGALRLQLPVAQSRVTAIGYHGGTESLALEPLGRQGNRGLLRRLVDRVFGTGEGRLVWYRLEGGDRSSTSVLDVGASAGTPVYAPVDGIVVGIGDVVLDGRRHGSRIDIQPATAPSLVVSVTRVRADRRLTVGAAVVAAASRLGTIVDLSRVEHQALSKYSRDAGNHVSLEVHAAATPQFP